MSFRLPVTPGTLYVTTWEEIASGMFMRPEYWLT